MAVLNVKGFEPEESRVLLAKTSKIGSFHVEVPCCTIGCCLLTGGEKTRSYLLGMVGCELPGHHGG